MQLSAKCEIILHMGLRATLNFPKFKVALNSIYRFFKILPKSCKNGGLSDLFLSYRHLKLKFRVFVNGFYRCFVDV